MDLLQAVTAEQVWARSNHLETKDGLPVYSLLGVGEYWDIKNPQGTQYDGFVYDDTGLYQRLTENDLVPAATAFKFNLANAGKGIYWGPRQYVPGICAPMLSDSAYRRYSSCSQFQNQNLGGPSVSWFEGPYVKDFAGDVGVRQALRQVYLWGVGWVNQEVNWYIPALGDRPQLGRAQWEKWMTGASSAQQVETYNLIKPGGVPALVFPCGPVKL